MSVLPVYWILPHNLIQEQVLQLDGMQLSLQDFLSWSGVEFLSKTASASNKMIVWILFFQVIYIMDYIYWFTCVESSLHLWDKA